MILRMTASSALYVLVTAVLWRAFGDRRHSMNPELDGLSALLGHPRFILFLLSISLSLYYFLCFPRVQKIEPLEDLPMPGEEEGPLTR